MHKIIASIIFVVIYNCCLAQGTEQAYPQTLHLISDTFKVKFSNYPDTFPISIGNKDTVDMGTDGAAGMVATIYYDKDSIRIPYRNLPYAQVHYIPIQTPARKIIYRLHFNSIMSSFSQEYIDKNKGNVQLEIPEVYELANIIWTLSPSGQRAADLNKSGAYYQKVLTYFKPYLNHPVFKKLDFADSVYFKNYYDFRENSFTFTFKGDKIVSQGPYYYVTGDDWDNYSSLFRRMLPLIEDFAKKSDYRKFYETNRALYAQQIQREKELMPTKNMWSWMETQFPARKYQSYKIVFSPLIGGSHSTQNYSTNSTSGQFNETVMFVCNTERYDQRPELTEKQKEGLMSGIVFTEIDHNYVNPVSNKYHNQIDSAFAKRALWSGVKANWYNSPVSVFNEYMTHAIFCLWVMDNYDKPTADLVIKSREDLMVNKRQFIKFREFDKALIALREQNKQKNIAELYPSMLVWCKAQN